MKTHKQSAQTFLVLVPHRDVRLVLRKYSDSLFKAGFCGAYSFPWVAPLAALSRPLTGDELKHCARALRESSLAANGGKITANETSAIAFPAHGNAESGAMLFGPRIDLLPNIFGGANSGACGENAAKKVTSLFSPLVIGACLLHETRAGTEDVPSAPSLSFRAAAVANMHWRPLQAACPGITGYEWKIGKLFWLPAVR